MIVGHTKFSPDAHFGMIKKKLQQAKCQSICDLIGENGLIQASPSSNRAICYKEFNSQIPNFRWYDWKAFIADKFKDLNKKLKGLSTWHVIKIGNESNFIEVAEAIGKPFREINVLNDFMIFNAEESPKMLDPTGISSNRLQELAYFEQFVDHNHKKFLSGNY